MLAESIEWLLTPCPASARRMGYLAESIAIRARARRCQAAWASHLAQSRAALLASADRCQRRRVALLLGSGPLLDVPLAELAGMFESVWLVDLVHPLAARRQVRRFANVRLIEHDASECLAELRAGSADLDALADRRPMRFLDEPDVDWVASLNLMSQLPNLPGRWLQRHQPRLSPAVVDRFGKALMQHHLDYLSRFPAPVCLLSDLEQVTEDRDGGVIERADLMPLLQDWRIVSQWRWDVAPFGELAAGRSAWHRVAALARG